MTTQTDLVANGSWMPTFGADNGIDPLSTAVTHAATVLPALGAAAPVLAILLTALFAMVLLGKVMR